MPELSTSLDPATATFSGTFSSAMLGMGVREGTWDSGVCDNLSVRLGFIYTRRAFLLASCQWSKQACLGPWLLMSILPGSLGGPENPMGPGWKGYEQSGSCLASMPLWAGGPSAGEYCRPEREMEGHEPQQAESDPVRRPGLLDAVQRPPKHFGGAVTPKSTLWLQAWC